MTFSHAEEKGPAKPHIWFKVTYSLASMSVTRTPEKPVTVLLPDDQEIIFWMRTFPAEKKIQPQLCCSAVAKRSMNEKLYSHFQKFVERVLPQDSSSKVMLPHRLSFDAEIDAHGRIPEKWGVNLEIFPNNFQELHREMSSKLHNLVKSYTKTLRWVQSATGKQAALAWVSFEYSFDKDLTIADAQDLSAYAIKKLANHKMAADVTAGYIVSDVERLRDPMNKIHKFIEDKVGKGVLDLSDKKKPKVIKAEPKKKAKH